MRKLSVAVSLVFAAAGCGPQPVSSAQSAETFESDSNDNEVDENSDAVDDDAAHSHHVDKAFEDREDGEDGDATNPLGIKTRKVCMTVHNPGDPQAITITGTIFNHHHYRPSTRAILFANGVTGTRSAFDGGSLGPAAGPSIARQMARKGYLVFTFDAAGYGESPYLAVNGGKKLTSQSYVSMMNEVVNQIKDGTYTVTDNDGTCPSGVAPAFGSNDVILYTVSGSSGEGIAYVAKYHGVKAFIPTVYQQVGLSATSSPPTAMMNRWIALQITKAVATGQDYTSIWSAGPFAGAPGGIVAAPAVDPSLSAQCVAAFYLEGVVDPELVRGACANETLPKAPLARLQTAGTLRVQNQTNVRLIGATGIPVLRIDGESDPFVPGAGSHQFDAHDLRTADINYWNANCGCDFTSYVQPGTKHITYHHPTMMAAVNTVSGWLADRGLTAEPARVH